jgi:hypothetical protein
MSTIGQLAAELHPANGHLCTQLKSQVAGLEQQPSNAPKAVRKFATNLLPNTGCNPDMP